MKKLLKQRDIQPIEKLIIILMMDWPSIIPFNLTSQEIATELGLKRKEVLNALDRLEEMGYIKCKVEPRRRTTTITERLKELINENR